MNILPKTSKTLTYETFRASSYLKFTFVNKEVVEVRNLLSGSLLKIDLQVYRILRELDSPKTLDEIHKKHKNIFSKRTLSDALFSLEASSIVVTEYSNESFSVVKTSGIFGFDNYGLKESASNVFLGVPYGAGNGIDNNCRAFPQAIRAYLNSQRISLNDDNLRNLDFRSIGQGARLDKLTAKLKSKSVKDWGDLYFERMEDTENIFNKITRATLALIDKNCVPFFLGGDHSITYPILSALNKKYEKFIVFQFDAHRDTYERKVGEFSNSARLPHHGNFMLDCIKLKNLEKVYQFGVRGLTNINSRKFKKIDTVYANHLNQIKFYREALDSKLPVYISFDIDFINPVVAPGTATPVPGGLDFLDTFKFLSKVISKKRIIGMDIVEVNPNRDKDFKTIQISAELILQLLNID